MGPAEHALLCNYYRRREDGPVTIEQLAADYPRINREVIVGAGARLEKAGYIEHVQPAGHRITEAGITAYLAE